MPEKVNKPDQICSICGAEYKSYWDGYCPDCEIEEDIKILEQQEKANVFDMILAKFKRESDRERSHIKNNADWEKHLRVVHDKTRQALYKAIIEDDRWPKKSKLREESEEWHISNLVTDAENGMISECESILASILGVKE